MRNPDSPIDELAAFYERFGQTLAPDIKALGSALAKYLRGEIGARLVLDAEMGLATTMRALFVESALMGAKRTLMHAEKAAGGSLPPSRIEVKYGQAVPSVPPSRAIADILSRAPRLARTAEEVSRLYSTDRVFALAKAATQVLAAKVQGVQAAAMASGTPFDTAAKVVAQMGDFDKNYAQSILETNGNTAYTNGIFSQARDPAVRSEIVGLEIVGPDDSSKRPNHKAALGWRAEVDDERWAVMRTPLGHRCRDSLNYIMRGHAERKGWLDRNGRLVPVPIPAGAGPDDNFRVR